MIFWGDFQATSFRCFRECGGGLSPRRTVMLANSPARPCPPTPPCAPTRPARGMSGFWTRQVLVADQCAVAFLSNPKLGHTTGGSGRGAQRSGGAGSGRTGRRQNSSPRRQATLAPPKASKTRRLNDSPEARTSETQFKPMEEHNDRLTTS